MQIDFSSIKNITILEGGVARIIRDSDGARLWEKPASYINLAVPNDTNTTDWNMWINNTRMGSDGAYRSNATSMVTNFIELEAGKQDTYYFSGMDIPENGFSSSIMSGVQVAFFGEEERGLGTAWISGYSFAEFDSKYGYYFDYTVNSSGIVTSMSQSDVWVKHPEYFSGKYYFRLCLPNTLDKSKIIITKNQPIE